MKNEFANNYKVALTKQKLDVYQANVITHYYVFYKIDQSDLRMEHGNVTCRKPRNAFKCDMKTFTFIFVYCPRNW